MKIIIKKSIENVAETGCADFRKMRIFKNGHPINQSIKFEQPVVKKNQNSFFVKVK